MSQFDTGPQPSNFTVPTSGWYQFGDGPPRLLTDEEVRAMGFDPPPGAPAGSPPECGDRWPRPERENQVTLWCTREQGHTGPHQAHVPDGRVVGAWDENGRVVPS